MQNNYRVLFVDSKTSQCTCKGIVSNFYTYIYIYAFSRRFYPKRLGHSGYTCFFFITMCVPWESNPQPFALPTQCSTTEPQEHFVAQGFEIYIYSLPCENQI